MACAVDADGKSHYQYQKDWVGNRAGLWAHRPSDLYGVLALDSGSKVGGLGGWNRCKR